VWLQKDPISVALIFHGLHLQENEVTNELANINKTLMKNLSTEQVSLVEEKLKPLIETVYINNFKAIIYYLAFFILLAIAFNKIPLINATICLQQIRKSELDGWPLEYLFEKKVLFNGEKHELEYTIPSYISKLCQLLEKHQNLINELDKNLKKPLKNLSNLFLAEVTNEDSQTNNIALVQIRYINPPIIEVGVSKGSLIYEGISYDKDENIFYWRTTPLCVDIFSLPEREWGSSESNKSANLLFKTMKGKIIKFKMNQEPNMHSDTEENFGDINIPKTIFSKHFRGYTPDPIQGFFTDVIKIEEGGGNRIVKRKALMRPIDHQLKNSISDSKKNLAKETCKDILKDARKFMIEYENGKELNVAEKAKIITDSNQLIRNWKSFVHNEGYWSSTSIFLSFLH
jgi:uncharacterized protein YifE (UPF0438 family)